MNVPKASSNPTSQQSQDVFQVNRGYRTVIPEAIRRRGINGIVKRQEADNEDYNERECAENSNKETTPLLRLSKNRRVPARKPDAHRRASC